MGSCDRATRAVSTAILAGILSSACDNQPLRGDDAVPCVSGPSQVFLASKLDDDDGDGNPHDEDFPRINDEDDDIADHAWVRDGGGVYHLFFQNEGRAGSDIEHYTSTDLRSLSYVGAALRPDPGGWDSYALWSPHIVQVGATFFMFYTGTTGPGSDPNALQRLGVATSTDLVHWTRVPVNRCPGTSGDGCVYECDEPWTTWAGAAGSYNRQCRDPFVLRDEANRRWVLFATAKSTNDFGVIVVAYSPDLTTWTGAGFIDATRRLPLGVGAQTTGGQAENAAVVGHDGIYDLLFTDWQDPEESCVVQDSRTMVQYATASTLTADSTGSPQWTYRGCIPDAGVNAIEIQSIAPHTWILSESIANKTCGDHEEHRRELRLKRVIWGANGAFRLLPFE